MLRRALPFALAAVATAAACGATPTRPPPDDAPGGQLTGCTPDVPVRGFKDSLANKLGSPRHVADDVIVGVGQPITIEGKFHYGKVGKDLEDEDVTLLVAADACGPWTPVDTRSTDDDGRVHNTYVRHGKDYPPKGTRYLAGELLAHVIAWPQLR